MYIHTVYMYLCTYVLQYVSISRIVYVYMRYEKSSSVYIRISQRSRSVKSRNAGLTTRNSYATLAKLA